MYERTVFPQARFMGQTPIGYAPGSDGAKNIEAFGDEVMGMLTTMRAQKEAKADQSNSSVAA